MDATLFETEYDAIIVGTGMMEAMVAGALARVGQKVLHLDPNDYYGSHDASLSLEQFQQWMQNTSSVSVSSEMISSEADSQVSNESVSVPCQVRHFQTAKSCHVVDAGFRNATVQTKLEKQWSQFCIDVHPRLVMSSEDLVQVLITSGVGRYLEFAAIENTFIQIAETKNGKATAKAPYPNPVGSNALVDTLWQVPCSKKDVFASKLLSMIEKRQLMKFLQFVADYGETQIIGEDVKSVNERALALGRALKRPQNKAHDASQANAWLEPFLDAPFTQLLHDHFHLSPKLQSVVVYCVALASFPAQLDAQEHIVDAQQMSARKGLAAVHRYVSSIGRYTGNAFLAPLYGVSEITQSFCRLCAVYGGIYVLRAPIDGIAVAENDPKTLVGVHCSDGRVLRAKHVIANPRFLDSSDAKEVLAEASDDATKHHRSQVLRGVFVLSRSLRLNLQRLVVIIPPHDPVLKNPCAIHVLQLDNGAFVCPRDCVLVQFSMALPTSWHRKDDQQQALVDAVLERLIGSAQAELLKETPTTPVVNTEDVVPATARSTSLTTETTTNKDGEETKEKDAVEAESGELTDKEASTNAQTPPALDPATQPWTEWIEWKAIFTMESYLYQPTTSPAEDAIWPPSVYGLVPKPTHVDPLELHLASASAHARAIFADLCPDQEFLPKSESAEQAERDEYEGEEDAVLQAAKRLADRADEQAVNEEAEQNLENKQPPTAATPTTDDSVQDEQAVKSEGAGENEVINA